MRKRKWGRVIYITSVSILEPIDDLMLSNAIRAAVAGMCKTLSNNYAADGVTFNCVCPGYTNTERLRSLAEKRAERTGSTTDDVMTSFAQGAPAKRLGEPDELGSLIAFLASTRAAYITGTAIPVDGGAVRAIL
jgi:3-oxoacyl-[acyl-carrier protein] reductase